MTPVPLHPGTRARGLDRLARAFVCARLRGLSQGRLTILERGQQSDFGAGSGPGAPAAAVRVFQPRFWRRVALGGAIGAAESYADGDWSCDDLVGFIRVFAREADVGDRVEHAWARVLARLRRLGHAMRKNSRRGARRNIREHYDLGDSFFSLWLDSTMTYSCAIYPRPEASLEEAQVAKIDGICRKLSLVPGQRLLEIGTGWGALAIHAAERYGARVVTTTISAAQHRFANARVAARGLSDRVQVLQRDYRDLEGTFDRIVSVEMIEAVGAESYDTYFDACSRRLAEDGLMLIQAIVIAEDRYERALRSVDFIQKHIFPGSCIPSVLAIRGAVARATDLRLENVEDITPHYVRTLRAWRERFLSAVDAVRQAGFSDRFVRLWEWYLAYCEGGFAERRIGDVQMLFAKPAARVSSAVLERGGAT